MKREKMFLGKERKGGKKKGGGRNAGKNGNEKCVRVGRGRSSGAAVLSVHKRASTSSRRAPEERKGEKK
jgi:hypothetical protein